MAWCYSCGIEILPGYSYCRDCVGYRRLEEDVLLHRWEVVMSWYAEEKMREEKRNEKAKRVLQREEGRRSVQRGSQEAQGQGPAEHGGADVSQEA